MMRTNIDCLRKEMRKAGIQAYIVPSSDDHGSEYLHPHFAAIAHLCGFTGSAGTLVVLMEHAALFTDGRYFLQAAEQLHDTGVSLMRMGEPGVPVIHAYIADKLHEGGQAGTQHVGVHARRMHASKWATLRDALDGQDIRLVNTDDLVAKHWVDRPAFPANPAYPHGLKHAGQSVLEKLHALRVQMHAYGADAYLVCAPEDIAWLYNMRGSDIPHNPVALCYSIVEQDAAYLYIQEDKPTPSLRETLLAAGVTLRGYDAIYADVKRYRKQRVLLDPERVNAALYQALEKHARMHAGIVEAPDPIMQCKMIKNETELQGMRQAHLSDGIAMVRFLYWLRQALETQTVTEVSAGHRLSAFRKEAGAVDDSFAPIVGYAAHAAIVHYTATPDSDAILNREGMLLIDSGGQYAEGTTDITRTISLGEVPQQQRRHFTLVLKGMLRCSAAHFPQSAYADQLDVLARAPLWSVGLDYNHGTGHGIGSFLCVHEDPVRLNYKNRTSPPLQAGMVLSIEPGVYIAGSHGVRIENQVCVEKAPSGYLCFETLTLAPIDRTLVEVRMLDETERTLINAYHARVYETLAPHLEEEIRTFLFEATRPL